MESVECAKNWKSICRIYDETIESNRPDTTLSRIIEELGFSATEETFATVAKIKESDGRIYGKNREYMNSVPVNPDSVIWRSENPMIRAGLDHIHTAHIDNIITELRKMAKN